MSQPNVPDDMYLERAEIDAALLEAFSKLLLNKGFNQADAAAIATSMTTKYSEAMGFSLTYDAQSMEVQALGAFASLLDPVNPIVVAAALAIIVDAIRVVELPADEPRRDEWYGERDHLLAHYDEDIENGSMIKVHVMSTGLENMLSGVDWDGVNLDGTEGDESNG